MNILEKDLPLHDILSKYFPQEYTCRAFRDYDQYDNPIGEAYFKFPGSIEMLKPEIAEPTLDQINLWHDHYKTWFTLKAQKDSLRAGLKRLEAEIKELEWEGLDNSAQQSEYNSKKTELQSLSGCKDCALEDYCGINCISERKSNIEARLNAEKA